MGTEPPQGHLYFICPTDYLEPIINTRFKHRNYYYSSLGNSLVLDEDTIDQIELLIKRHNIREVSFVLSSNNAMISDALGHQDFLKIKGLKNFYNEVLRQKEYSEVLWQQGNRQFTLLSYYLNTKIKELQLKLNSLVIDQIKISGKIYNRQENAFDEIYTDLICGEYLSLN